MGVNGEDFSAFLNLGGTTHTNAGTYSDRGEILVETIQNRVRSCSLNRHGIEE
jgi:hypothetical protein